MSDEICGCGHPRTDHPNDGWCVGDSFCKCSTFKAPPPMARRYCYPQCRDPWFNECAECWRSGGNPVLYAGKGGEGA